MYYKRVSKKNRSLPFLERYADRIEPIPMCGCMIWMGATTTRHGYGYGEVTINKKVLYAHRECYIEHFGAIPAGLNVCHSCDIPSCVNPSHFFCGTDGDNAWDKVNKGRDNRTSRCRGDAWYQARIKSPFFKNITTTKVAT